MANATTKKLRKRVQALSTIAKGLQVALLELKLSQQDSEVLSRQESLVITELEDAVRKLTSLDDVLARKRKAKKAQKELDKIDQERQLLKNQRVEEAHKTSDFYKSVHEVPGGAPGSGRRS